MTRIIAVAGLWLLASAPALAHDLRPIFIDASQSSVESLALRWKVPSSVLRTQLPVVSLTDGCQPQNEAQVALRGDSYQADRIYRCESGLTGEVLSLDLLS